MTKYNFIKTLTSGVALALALYPQAFAANSGNCGTNCSWEIADGELKITATGANAQIQDYDIDHNYYPPWRNGNFTKVTIGEGIIGVGRYTLFAHSVSEVSLPSTLQTIAGRAFANSRVDKIEIPASVTSIGGQVFSEGVGEMIITSESTYVLNDQIFNSIYTGKAPSNNKISCKGNYNVCANRIANLKRNIENQGGSVSLGYYKGIDEDGNYVEYSENGKDVYTDSTMQKPLGKYDSEGNQTGVYKYDKGGNMVAAYENGVATYKRTSYTPAEAAKAVKKGNANKVTLTFK